MSGFGSEDSYEMVQKPEPKQNPKFGIGGKKVTHISSDMYFGRDEPTAEDLAAKHQLSKVYTITVKCMHYSKLITEKCIYYI